MGVCKPSSDYVEQSGGASCCRVRARHTVPSVMLSLADTNQASVDQSSCVDEVPPTVERPSRRLRHRCHSLQRPRSLWLGVLVKAVLLMVQRQGEMNRKTLDVGMRRERRGGELCRSCQLSLHGSCIILSIRCSQSLHTRLSLLSMNTSV